MSKDRGSNVRELAPVTLGQRATGLAGNVNSTTGYVVMYGPAHLPLDQ